MFKHYNNWLQQAPSEALRNRPGPTPFTVKHSSDGFVLDDADLADDDDEQERHVFRQVVRSLLLTFSMELCV